MISGDRKNAETINDFFLKVVPSLNISLKENHEPDKKNDIEPILNYINKFKNHPSVKVTKSRKKEEQTFTFNYASYEEVHKKFRKLQTVTTIHKSDILTKTLKENSEVFARYFHGKMNFYIDNSIFSDLEVADVTPVFEKISRLQKITEDRHHFT